MHVNSNTILQSYSDLALKSPRARTDRDQQLHIYIVSWGSRWGEQGAMEARTCTAGH